MSRRGRAPGARAHPSLTQQDGRAPQPPPTKKTQASTSGSPPQLERECDQALAAAAVVTQGQVERLLRAVDVRKAAGLDGSVPRLCRGDTRPPRGQRLAKRRDTRRPGPATYRRAFLLSVVGKALERVVVAAAARGLQDRSRVSNQQLRFGPGCCTPGLLVLLPRAWRHALATALRVTHDTSRVFRRVRQQACWRR